MRAISNDALLKQLRWRYAVKKFEAGKKIPTQDWETLEDALVLSPSSYGLQPWKFLVIQNDELRKKLTPATWNQTQVCDCSHYVVLLLKEKVDEKYIDQYVLEISKVRGVLENTLGSYRQFMMGDLVTGNRNKIIYDWAARQTYIALGNLMTTAAVLGIDACPIEGFEPDKYDEILNLKGTGYGSLVCCALGYRSEDDKYAKVPKVRFDKSKVIQYL